MTSRTPTTQQQKTKAPNSKTDKGLGWIFLQRYTDGQQVHEKVINITNH